MLNEQISFTVHLLPFTMRYPFPVFLDRWLMANGKCMVNRKWLMVNEAGGVLCP